MREDKNELNTPETIGEIEDTPSGGVIAPEAPDRDGDNAEIHHEANAPAIDEEMPPPDIKPEIPPEEKKRKNKRREKNTETKPEKQKKFSGKRRRVRGDQIVRIEELESALANENSDVDPDAVVSMYIPRRRFRRFGAVLLRTNKLQVLLLCLLLGVAILFILSFMQEKMGNFTINLNRLELYRKGISIAADGDFTEPTARLTANVVDDATNISIEDLPSNLDSIDGDHNGKNYMAYTYYVRNAGKVDVGYIASLKLTAFAKGAQEAVRVAVWHNGERTVYAAPAADGEPEEGCVSFLTDTVVCEYDSADFLVGNVDKYTIVIWMEGDDPECLDNIVGGSVEFSMSIDSDSDENTSLLKKFIQDIWDTLTGNKPIDAAGTEAPDYYNAEGVTWSTRRNQDGVENDADTQIEEAS